MRAENRAREGKAPDWMEEVCAAIEVSHRDWATRPALRALSRYPLPSACVVPARVVVRPNRGGTKFEKDQAAGRTWAVCTLHLSLSHHEDRKYRHGDRRPSARPKSTAGPPRNRPARRRHPRISQDGPKKST